MSNKKNFTDIFNISRQEALEAYFKAQKEMLEFKLNRNRKDKDIARKRFLKKEIARLSMILF